MPLTLRMTGWRPGLKKAEAVALLERIGGLGVEAASKTLYRLLSGHIVEVPINSDPDARRLAKELRSLGIVVEVTGERGLRLLLSCLERRLRRDPLGGAGNMRLAGERMKIEKMQPLVQGEIRRIYHVGGVHVAGEPDLDRVSQAIENTDLAALSGWDCDAAADDYAIIDIVETADGRWYLIATLSRWEPYAPDGVFAVTETEPLPDRFEQTFPLSVK